jgi:hypothetical protein
LQIGGFEFGKLTCPGAGHCRSFDEQTELWAVAIGRSNDEADRVFRQNNVSRLSGVRDGREPRFLGQTLGDAIIMVGG